MYNTDLARGSTVGQYPILSKQDIPMKFREYAGRLQYSKDNGKTWNNIGG